MPERVLRIWTRDLQIFSLTLSQLSYLGSHANIKNNVKQTEEIRKRNNEHKQLKETFYWLSKNGSRQQQENCKIDCINMKFYKNKILEKSCRDPGLFRTHAGASSPYLNQGPSDLQSDALPTELSRQSCKY